MNFFSYFPRESVQKIEAIINSSNETIPPPSIKTKTIFTKKIESSPADRILNNNFVKNQKETIKKNDKKISSVMTASFLGVPHTKNSQTENLENKLKIQSKFKMAEESKQPWINILGNFESKRKITEETKLKSANKNLNHRQSSLNFSSDGRHARNFSLEEKNKINNCLKTDLIEGESSYFPVNNKKILRRSDSIHESSDGYEYESRLKVLEEKIKKHKYDMQTFLSQNSKSKCGGDGKRKIGGAPLDFSLGKNVKTELNRTKLESNSIQFDFPFTDGHNYKTNRKGSNYGIISASDLLKLRSPEILS